MNNLNQSILYTGAPNINESNYGASFYEVPKTKPKHYEYDVNFITSKPWLAQNTLSQERYSLNMIKEQNQEPVETYKTLKYEPIPDNMYELINDDAIENFDNKQNSDEQNKLLSSKFILNKKRDKSVGPKFQGITNMIFRLFLSFLFLYMIYFFINMY